MTGDREAREGENKTKNHLPGSNLEIETWFSGILEDVPIGIAHVSLGGVFLRVNKRVCLILGHSREALLGSNFLELSVPEDRGDSENARTALLSGNLDSYLVEKRYRRSDGEVVWINLVTKLARTPAGEPEYFTSVFEDITGRKVAEFRLHRLNRLHEVLSKTGSAVSAVREGLDLYREVCRILVVDGLLSLAFVAEVDPGTRIVTPIVSYGDRPDYLDGIEITVDGGPRSLGTVGTAIQTGHPDISNDIANDSRMAPWRDRLLDYGFRATASFPIHREGTTIGALVVFASEAEYFKDDEIRLMVAVADHISLGLEMRLQDRQRLKAESSLKASERQFYTAFEYSAIGLALVDQEGRFLKVNRSLCQMLGYKKSALTKLTFQEITHPDDLHGDLENCRQLLSGATKSFQMEKRYLHRGGHWVWALLSVSLVWDDDGHPLHFISQLQDITSRRLAGEAVRMQAHMLGHIGQAAIATDLKGRIIYANRFAAELYGWQQEEMLGRSILNVTIPRNHRTKAARVMKLLMKGESWTGEFDVKRRDGSIFPSEITNSPLLDEVGNLIAIIGISSDISARRQSEEALRFKNSLLRIAGSVTRTGGWAIELGSPSQLFWSDEIFEILGYPPGPTPPLADALALYQGSSKKLIADAMEACEKEGTSFDLDLQIATFTGRTIWVRAWGEADQRADGSICRIQGAFQDISQRRESEQALRRSEQRYRSLVEATTAIVWDTPTSGKFETEQPAWSEFTGQPFQELRDFGWLNAIHPDDRAETMEVWMAAVGSRDVYKVEHRLWGRDGKYHEMMVRAVPILDEDGEVRHFIGVHTDITERKQGEEELRWKTALLEAQVDSYSSAILVVDNFGKQILRNRRVSELWSIPDRVADDTDNAEELEFVKNRTKDPEAFTAKIAFLNANPGENSSDEIELIDGTVLERYSAPVIGKDGKHYGRIWTFTDITSRRLAETEAQQLNLRLIDTSRRAGMAEVATSVLHNVGNVLNSVNVSATLASEVISKISSADLIKVSELLETNKSRLADYLTGTQGSQIPSFLLALAKNIEENRKTAHAELQLLISHVDHIKDIVAGQQSHSRVALSVENMAVESLVRDSLRINGPAITQHGIETRFDNHDRHMVMVDKHKALQILINLISNAVNAMSGNGAGGKRLTIGVTRYGKKSVRISVKDEGVGIPEENLLRIFEHGFTTRSEGHGFGLHSAALAARELGGALTVRSDGPGRGAVFILSLPIESEHKLH